MIEIKGKLIKLMPEMRGNSRSGNEWIKQDFIIETQEQYPRKICITAWGEKVEEARAFQPGDDLTMSVSIESREYNDKWYTDVKLWRFEGASPKQARPEDDEYPMPNSEGSQLSESSQLPSDDLPF